MALSSFFHSTAKTTTEAVDSRCTTPTPSGVATPRPDPTDKRLPGILASYFGQVGASPCPRKPCSSLVDPHSPLALSLRCSISTMEPALGVTASSSTQSLSAIPTIDKPQIKKMLLPHERIELPPSQQDTPQHLIQHGYPTPPTSCCTSCSSSRPQSSCETAGTTVSSGPEQCITAQPLRHRRSLFDRPPTSLRRSTLTADPLMSVTSTPHVLASHISKPDLKLSLSKTNVPITSRRPASRSPPTRSRRSSPSSKQHGLTEGVTLSRNQTATPTPPRTPRTLSYDSRSRGQSPGEGQIRTKRKGSTAEPLLGEPKGKLWVSIVEGRGLRSSIDPYIICQFQWNEWVSKGPRRTDGLGSSGDSLDVPAGPVPISRTASEMGRAMAIPLKSRTNSHTSISSRGSPSSKPVAAELSNPVWHHEVIFDVVGEQNELDISVYDHSTQESFLGHVRFCPILQESDTPLDHWFRLDSRNLDDAEVTGEIRLCMKFQKVEKKHYGPEDFQILKLIGKGTFGQVFQVRKRDTHRVYAMKVLSKKVIVQKKEVAHTLGERNILVRTAMTDSPFIVGLKFSFQTPSDLYLVTDYMSGGELFWHLQKEGRFQEPRAKFYIAELILALEHLHKHDIVYRDLKPENILLDANGHIALCDFGLSKANLTKDETTNTFCGTTEYLAPEVLLDEQGYTKMVDFWSLGVLVFEMCCGWSPFYAEDTQQMYKNIAFGKVRFPRDALSAEGRNFVKGLLNRNPKHRLGAISDAAELKAHPFFNDIRWDALAKKDIVPPFKPRLKSELDTSNFDPEFTNALNGAGSLNERAQQISSGIDTASTPLSPTVQANFRGFTFVDESVMEQQMQQERNRDAMDEDHEENFAPLSPQLSRDEKMSGMHGSGADEGLFNAEGL